MSVAISHRRSTGRAELYLVPPLPDADDCRDADAAPGRVIIPRQRGVDSAPAGRTVARTRVRLTRRGRIVLGVLVLAVFVGLAMAFGSATQAAAPTGPDRTVVVRSGDTLWSVATAALPDEKPYAAVERVRLLNHLPDNEIYAGEQLLLPPK
jgi:LysM repeat protein